MAYWYGGAILHRNFCSHLASIAFHDAFSLYGRPRAYPWDPRDQASMMFAYPVGPDRDVGVRPSSHTLLTLIYHRSVTIFGSRCSRGHGPPGRSHIPRSVPTSEHTLYSYAAWFFNRGHYIANIESNLDNHFSLICGRTSHGNDPR